MTQRKPKKDRETNAAILRAAMLRRLPRQLRATSEVAIPAVPGLLDHYVQMFGTLFATVGRPFSAEELAHMRGLLATKLAEAYAISPFSKVVVKYQTDPLPQTSLTYWVSIAESSIAGEYATWVNARTPPLFGSRPDAKVMELASSLGPPEEVPVIDIGAGTGRNTIPLAQAGFPTDAVELAPSLAAILREELAQHELTKTQVFEGNILDPNLALPSEHYRLVVLAEVVASHFRDVAEIRALFQAAQKLLKPGGLLAFSAFLSSDGYKADAAARELSQVLWCCLFTRRELAEAALELPFERVSDESVAEYERARVPDADWPPTGWFSEWAGGQDLFDLPEGKPPLELRWLVYRRT
ncbi:MAG TPA: class I SAM-dependent methyltransferase [Polyangiaceae bacterium]|jgi:SAM-dependent methyltransferase